MTTPAPAPRSDLPAVPSRLPREVGRLATAFAAAIAVLSLAFGCYATIKSDNQAGTAGAFVAGLFASMVAMTGRIPRLKWGDNEIGYEQAYRTGVEVGHDRGVLDGAGAAIDVVTENEDDTDTTELVDSVAQKLLLMNPPGGASWLRAPNEELSLSAQRFRATLFAKMLDLEMTDKAREEQQRSLKLLEERLRAQRGQAEPPT